VLLHRVGPPGEPARAHQGGRLHTGGRAPPLHPPPRRLHEPVRLEQRGPGPEEQTQLFWNHERGYLQVQLYNLKELKADNFISLFLHLSFPLISQEYPAFFCWYCLITPNLVPLPQP
jgi:hypothetical protein